MKYLLAAIAVLALTSPSLAFDRDAYKADKDQWHDNWKDTKKDWKADGRPEPKPTKPAKPDRHDY